MTSLCPTLLLSCHRVPSNMIKGRNIRVGFLYNSKIAKNLEIASPVFGSESGGKIIQYQHSVWIENSEEEKRKRGVKITISLRERK